MVQCYECGTVYPETMRCCPNCGSEAKIQLAPNSEFEEPKNPYVQPYRPQAAEEVFSSLFLAGGLVLSQVTQVTGLEPYIIQNWVRRGFLAPPKQRKYTRRQLSRILMINALKSTLSIEQSCKLLSYINGALDDEGDDTIDDTELYGAFVLVAGSVQKHGLTSESEMNRLITDGLKDYKESIPGAKERI